MNRQETAQILSVLFAAFPSARPPNQKAEQTLDVWEASLGDLPFDKVKQAAISLIQTRTFLPAIAEIRSCVAQMTHGRVRSGAEAWPGVVAAMRQEGAYRTPGVEFVFADQIAARCVQLMDWQTLCLSENTVADRARFIELYDKLAAEVRAENASPALVAIRGAGSVTKLVASTPRPIGHLIRDLVEPVRLDDIEREMNKAKPDDEE